jgi:predicted dehydrogenase
VPDVSEPIRLAVVGTGFGCLTHVRAARRAGLDVVALVGRDRNKTAARAERFEITHACSSIDDALRLTEVDAVTIVTPPHTHADLARNAISAGKHVVCEKPFTRDMSEARTLLEAARRAGVVHVLGAEMRYSPGQALLTRAVRSGAIGVPRLATFLLHIPVLADSDAVVPDWWADADAGGGWLGAHAPHVVDEVRTMLGEIDQVSASLPRIVNREWTAEDAYLVPFKTIDGCAGVMQATASDRGPMLFITRILGTEGTAWVEGERVQVATAGGTSEIPMPADLVVAAPLPPPSDLLFTAYDQLHSFGIDYGPYLRLYEHFAARILGAEPPAGGAPATFEDGVANMAVLDAIRASAAAGGATVKVAV